MKRMLRPFAAFLAVWLLLSLLPSGAFAAAAQPSAPAVLRRALPPAEERDTGKEEIAQAQSVVGDLAAFKAFLLEHLAACEEEIDVSAYQIPLDQAQLLSNLIYYAIPEAFHVTGAGYSWYTGGTTVVSLCPKYDRNALDYAVALDQCRTAAAPLLAGVQGNEALSDVQKALLLHDRLATHVAYHLPEEGVETHHDCATLYAALVNRKAVCQGYALTYGYLLDQVGIENTYVSSDALNHAWNMVTIDGEPYFVDVTWDDPANDIPGRVLHDNFLLSTAAFKADPSNHNADDFQTQPSDTRYDNAFWHCSESAFCLSGDTLYYVDNGEQQIRDWDGNALRDIPCTWPAGGSSYWIGNFTRLAAAGDLLLYHDTRVVYEWDPQGATARPIYTLTDEDQAVSIYGFVYEAPYLKLYTGHSPSFPEKIPDANEIWVYYEIYQPKPVVALTASPSPVSLTVGETVGMEITIDPVDADNQNLTWSGWDETIVSVTGADRGGFITALAPGETQITVSSTDGVTLTVSVSVVCPHTTQAESVENRVEPSCGKAGGYDKVITCSDCGEELSRTHVTLEALTHDYVSVVVSPTCTTGGYTVHTCSHCGDSYLTDEISALTHAWGDVTYTWSEDGLRCTATRTCARDASHVETETVDATVRVEREATEQEAGLRVYRALFTNPAFAAQEREENFDYVPFIWGDANGDGMVSSKDIVRLKNYFANYNDATGTSTVEISPGADANGDGVISSKDIVRLKNFFANYNDNTGASTVVLGPKKQTA